jgi:hypothetical protein
MKVEFGAARRQISDLDLPKSLQEFNARQILHVTVVQSWRSAPRMADRACVIN